MSSIEGCMLKGCTDDAEAEVFSASHVGGSSGDRYLVINNISKIKNIKNLCLIAGACNFCVLFVQPSENTLEETVRSSYLACRNLFVQHLVFSTLEEMKTYLVGKQIPLVGIEIMETAISMKAYSYEQKRGIAFMPGNEGMGLTPKQKNVCSHFMYIPQFGAGTASLNVNLATSIVLHDYCSRTNSSQTKEDHDNQVNI